MPAPVAAIGVMPSASAQLLLPVTLNGRASIFELDTGADLSLVSGRQASALGLTTRTAPNPLLAGADGKPLSDYVSVGDFTIGTLRQGAATLVLVPGWSALDDRAAGLIGGDVLTRWDLGLDVAAGAISFYRNDACPAGLAPFSGRAYSAAIDVIDGHAVVMVTLDGQVLTALIDTGATRSSMPLDLAGRRFGLRAGGAGVTQTPGTITSSGGRLATWRRRFAMLDVAGLQLAAPEIDLIARQSSPNLAGTHDMVLGLPELRRMRLYLSYRRRRLYVAANGQAG
ncbi:MAG TPA: retropepsin-like aspartic protease [Stellaceae bacterium]|nr:retropepsin-like aspartic protease [Stellaceae bacterium]